MQVSRDRRGGQALVAMAVDSAIPPEVAEQVRTAMDASAIHVVNLVG
jgi:D-3-phosphoglycerate dehydrogenase